MGASSNQDLPRPPPASAVALAWCPLSLLVLGYLLALLCFDPAAFVGDVPLDPAGASCSPRGVALTVAFPADPAAPSAAPSPSAAAAPSPAAASASASASSAPRHSTRWHAQQAAAAHQQREGQRQARAWRPSFVVAVAVCQEPPDALAWIDALCDRQAAATSAEAQAAATPAAGVAAGAALWRVVVYHQCDGRHPGDAPHLALERSGHLGTDHFLDALGDTVRAR